LADIIESEKFELYKLLPLIGFDERIEGNINMLIANEYDLIISNSICFQRGKNVNH
jgi:hypothetical protein